MSAISTVLAERPEIPAGDSRLFAFFNELDAGATLLEARRSSHGVGLTEALAIQLRRSLSAIYDNDPVPA
jgi:hypothetical protein